MLPYEFSSRFLPLEDIINLKLVSKALTSTIRNISTVSVTTPCLPLNRLETILQVLPNIRELNISDASTLVLGVDFFSRKCLTNITHLKLKRFPLGFLSSNAEALSFSPLQHLEIYNLPSHGEPLLEKILQFPKLTKLHFQECLAINDENINHFMSNTTQKLDELYLVTCFNLYNINIHDEQILTPNRIKKLNVSRSLFITNISGFSKLTSCDVSHTNVSSLCIENLLSNCLQLQYLNVSYCTSITHIQSTSSSIQDLDFTCCSMLSFLYLNTSEILNLNLNLCSSLKKLELYSDKIKRLNLSMLTALINIDLNCSQLRFLDLSGCTNIGIDSDNLLKMNTTDSSFLINNKNKWTNSNIAPPTISSEKILTTNHSNSIHNDNDNEYLECFLFRLRVGCPLLLLKEQHLGGTSLRKIFQNETQVIEDEIKGMKLEGDESAINDLNNIIPRKNSNNSDENGDGNISNSNNNSKMNKKSQRKKKNIRRSDSL